MTRTRTAVLYFACAAFVAYLSFVPFHFQQLPLDEALARFARIPYLDLGAGSRADWVANILMFVPLGWLAAAWFVPHPRGRFDLRAILPAVALGALWAVAIEFAQLYFPNRTVSLNDIVAEVLGSLLGASLWSAFGTHGREWWRALLRGGPTTAKAALAAYVLAYLVLSFSPFDFVVSAEELVAKANSALYGWWMAPVSCGRTPCSVKLLTELMAVLPFGWWWAMRSRGSAIAGAAVLGFALGALIELAQFLLVSGTSQGASVVARAAGMAAGAWLHGERDRIARFDWRRWGRPLVLAALPPYLVAVGYVSGWVGGQWLGWDAGLARAGDVRWLPFFYQYFSTEQALIRSTLVHLALYAPVGAAVWMWRRTGKGSTILAAGLAAALAAVAESGKLFLAGKHPDYTDVLFAAVAAAAAMAVLRRATEHDAASMPDFAMAVRRSSGDVRRSDAPGAATAEPSKATGAAAVAGWRAEVDAGTGSAAGLPLRAAGVALLVLTAVSVAFFPLWQAALALAIAAYALALARWPTAYLLVLPAALPLLDLAPYSGRLFWDEFDLLLATTVGVRLLMALPAGKPAAAAAPAALWLLGASVAASMAMALWPPAPLDANAFAGYLSPFNALRVGKGYLWAFLLLWLIRRDTTAGRPVLAQLMLGLGLGVLAAALGVFAERALFVGLTDLTAWFRAAGFVSATHVGGAYLEAVLVALVPFALALALMSSAAAVRVLWFAVALLGVVAVFLTLSRAAYAAVVLVAVVFGALCMLRPARRPRHSARLWPWATAAMVLGVVGFAGVLAQAGALRERFAFSGVDFAARMAHWHESLSLIRGDALRLGFGMGLGSYPREFYLANAFSYRLPSYRLGGDPADGQRYLTLLGGRSQYVDQRIAAVAGGELRLRGRIRSPDGEGRLAIGLCEKSLLASVRCEWVEGVAARDWQRFEARLSLSARPAGGFKPPTPVTLSMHNGSFGTRVDITELSLTDGRRELLVNGSFENGLDRWFMTSDAHLAWRAHSTWLQIAFEQGVLGVLAWLALAVAVMAATARSALPAAAAAAVLSSLLGVVVVGSFDSLLDSPRQIVLLGLIASAGLCAAMPARQRAPIPADSFSGRRQTSA